MYFVRRLFVGCHRRAVGDVRPSVCQTPLRRSVWWVNRVNRVNRVSWGARVAAEGLRTKRAGGSERMHRLRVRLSTGRRSSSCCCSSLLPAAPAAAPAPAAPCCCCCCCSCACSCCPTPAPAVLTARLTHAFSKHSHTHTVNTFLQQGFTSHNDRWSGIPSVTACRFLVT